MTIGAGSTLTITATGGTDNEGEVEFYDAVTLGTGASLTITATGGADGDAYVEFDDPVKVGNMANVERHGHRRDGWRVGN